MRIIHAFTGKGSLTNCVFFEDNNGDKHCFSYDSNVASIIDGQYIEYQGPMFYSRTSVKHKNLFKEYYKVKESK